MSLFTHPNIREQSVEQLQLRIKQKQDQRLLAAIQAQTLRHEKLAKVAAKDQDKYTKLGDRLATRLAKIELDLQRCEDDLMTMQKLAGEMSLIEQELGG